MPIRIRRGALPPSAAFAYPERALIISRLHLLAVLVQVEAAAVGEDLDAPSGKEAHIVVLRSYDLIAAVVYVPPLAAELHGYLVYPGVGMLISLVLLRLFIKDDIGHGVTKVLVAVSKNESRIRPHNMWSSLLTSSLTIGFGGSVGAEAPIVYTGAAIGSNVAKVMGLSYRNMTTLLGCGAAGAVAGIFKAPLAGVLFTLEILLFNISMSSMMPLLLSTVSATVVSYIFMGDSFAFACTTSPFVIRNIPFYILLGIACGGCSLYFQRTTLALEDRLAKITNPFRRWAVCAVCLGVLIFLFPPLYG